MFEFDLPFGALEKFKKLSKHTNKKDMLDLSIIEEQNEIKNIISDIISVESYHYGNLFAHNTLTTILIIEVSKAVIIDFSITNTIKQWLEIYQVHLAV
jgi:hypothetical protein